MICTHEANITDIKLHKESSLLDEDDTVESACIGDFCTWNKSIVYNHHTLWKFLHYILIAKAGAIRWRSDGSTESGYAYVMLLSNVLAEQTLFRFSNLRKRILLGECKYSQDDCTHRRRKMGTKCGAVIPLFCFLIFFLLLFFFSFFSISLFSSRYSCFTMLFVINLV